MEQKRARDEEEEEEEEEGGGGGGGDGGFLKKLCRGLGIVEEEEEELELQRQQQEQDQGGAEVGLDGSDIADREELLSGVIKSLEEEINLSSSAASSPSPSPALPPPPPPPLSRLYSAASSAELSYLLEASDDELGISIASPALSEADLAGTCCGEDQLRANSILDLLEGEVISLASSDFPEFEEEWIRRTVATMEMVVDSPPPPPPPPPCLVDWNGSSLETTGQPLLIESRK